MPFSTGKFKLETKELLIKKFPRDTQVLDVGPGSGIYADILSDWFYDIDAIEIYEPYISQFCLRKKYRKVQIFDVRNLTTIDYEMIGCDIVIMGDVLEHLSVEEAQHVLSTIAYVGCFVIAAVPYNYEQGEEMGNVHETHLQPDLDESMMAERYPGLTLYVGDDTMGVYVSNTTKIAGKPRTDWAQQRIIDQHIQEKAMKELEHKELRRWIAQDVQIDHPLSKDQDIGEL